MVADEADAGDARARLRALVRSEELRDADVPTLLTWLCQVAVKELDLSGAGVILMSRNDSGSVEHEVVAAASDDRARTVEGLELGLGEGPGRDALASGRPVLTPDLSTRIGRWPGYAPAAIEAGDGAVFAYPLHVGAVRFGVLSLHAAGTRRVTSSQVAAMLALADLATEILLDSELPGAASSAGPGFLDELDLSDEIYQAQGMVTVDLDVSLPDALTLLRAHAYGNGIRLRDLAVDIVAGRTRLTEKPRPPETGPA